MSRAIYLSLKRRRILRRAEELRRRGFVPKLSKEVAEALAELRAESGKVNVTKR